MRKYTKIAHPLKDAIKKKFKTVDAFCEYTGIQKNTMYYLFKGRNSINDGTKMVIMDALDIGISDLWVMLYG